MKKLTRLLALLLCAAMLLGLAACGGSDGKEADAADPTDASDTGEAAEPETPDEPETPEEPETPDEHDPEPAPSDAPDTAETPDASDEPDAAAEDYFTITLPDGTEFGRVSAYTDDYLSDVTSVTIGGSDAVLVNLTIGGDTEMHCVELSFTDNGETMVFTWWGLYRLSLHVTDETDEGYVIDDYDQEQIDAADYFSGTCTLHFDADTEEDLTVDTVTFYDDMTCTIEENGEIYTAMYAGNEKTVYLFLPTDDSVTPLTDETMDEDGGNCAYFMLLAYDYEADGSDITVSGGYTALLNAEYLLNM